MIALLLSLLAAAPPPARFVLEVAGLPVAELRVSVQGERYLYEATHFLEEGPRAHRLELDLPSLAAEPEVLALLHRPTAVGCRQVLEERTGALEPLCVRALEPGLARGTLADEPFTARYDKAGALSSIDVGPARWTAAAAPTRAPRESPFTAGLPVHEGALVLTPPVPGSRWLGAPPRGIGTPEQVGRARCLMLARAALAQRPGAELAVGLVVEDGRAYPHAWLREGDAALDPSVLPDDPVLSSRRYLEIPRARSGAFFLRWFEGSVQLRAR